MGGRGVRLQTSPLIELLRDLLDEAFERRAWHGTTLRGSLRGMSADLATWRPAPQRHNVWEIVQHCAYWKYAVRRRLAGDPRGTFALEGSDWFATPRPATTAAWKAAIQLLSQEHRQLRSVVETLQPDDLERPAGGGTTRTVSLVRGIAAHDLYHAGQIQLLKKLHVAR